jgi:hypothetical protein
LDCGSPEIDKEGWRRKELIKHRNKLIGIAAVVALFSGTAYAGTVTDPLLSGNATISHGTLTDATWNLNSATFIDNGNGTFTYSGNNNSSSPTWGFTWNVTVNPDPVINSTLTVINKTDNTETFNILFTLPVGSSFAPGIKSGSMSATAFDFNGNGFPADGTLGLTNIDWNGQIDGANALPMSTVDINCGPGSPGCTGSIGLLSNGPLSHPAGVSTSIGIHLVFDLTAGDKATFINHFEVVPVPIPAAVWLFGSGLLGLGAFARRRQN